MRHSSGLLLRLRVDALMNPVMRIVEIHIIGMYGMDRSPSLTIRNTFSAFDGVIGRPRETCLCKRVGGYVPAPHGFKQGGKADHRKHLVYNMYKYTSIFFA